MSSSNSDSEQINIKRPKYSQKYKEEWEQLPEFKGWLQKSEKSDQYARCKCCDKNINIKSGKDSLIKHSLRNVHKEKCASLSKQSLITSFIAKPGTSAISLENEVKEAEIRMSGFIAEHNLPFNLTEHLPKLITTMCPDSKIAKRLACSRTKTAAIVNKLIGPHSFQLLCEDLRNTRFSLIADESTDKTTMKHLCLVVRYFDGTIVRDHFLALIQLSGADANTLYGHIKNFFIDNKIPYKQNLIGFASDGANVMMGSQHSLMTLLKNDVPSLHIMKCICHSFHLCASYACEKLPRFVEDVTRDIYNYFSSSPKRIAEYAEFQTFCEIKIHKILHPSQTRWLSVQSVVSRILEQYAALQLFFTDAVANKDLLAAENILQKLNDPLTKLFLQFLEYVLPFFTNLNKEMQSESPKVHLLYKNICQILRTVFDCFIKRDYLKQTPLENVEYKNPTNYLPIHKVYFGVSKSLLEVNLSSEQIHLFRVRCLDFYVEACSQIIQRFPLKNNILKLLNFIDPDVVQDGTIDSISEVVINFSHLLSNNDLQVIDSEWRSLRNIDDIQSFPKETILFWQKIKSLTFGDGSPMFNLLPDFVFNILSLPHSSANVERLFSSINLMKTKQRNKLSTSSIIGLLHTKRYIGNNNCYDFHVDKKLISAMNSKTLYVTSSEDD